MSRPWQTVLRTLPTETVPDCPLCQHQSGVPDPDFAQLLALDTAYGVRRCPRCALRWLSPRPTAAGYATLYSDALYFGGEGASPDDYRTEAATRMAAWRKRVQASVRLLHTAYPQPATARPVNFLDYGAATGEFVHVTQAEGHACTGLELSADARATARTRYGIDLLSPEDAARLEDRRFDIIHMNHVLEHLPDPLAHLRWCRQHLQPGGLLVLEVPQQFDNDLDRLRRLLHQGGRRARFDAYSLHHAWFFTPATMHRLLAKSGFAVERLATFNPDKTPWWPPLAKNWVLRPLLTLADRIHQGGNIIEVFARRI